MCLIEIAIYLSVRFPILTSFGKLFTVFSLKQGEMIRMRTKTSTKSMSESSDSGSIGSEQVEWELRPGGMLVQKRDPDSDGDRAASIIKLRVKYGSSLHEIHISPQAAFGKNPLFPH